MLQSFPSSARYFLYAGPTDMRKSFDGLCGLIINHLGEDPMSGDVFIFMNRRRSLIKLLVWDQTGFVIFYKRLEKGTFEMPSIGKDRSSVKITRSTLMLILEGISLNSIQTRRRYHREKIY